MIWLIDGHNLIGQLQDLSLEDPQDEAKLTLAIKRYIGRSNGKDRAVVYFDNGLPGGLSKELSSHYVEVRFAPPRTSADHLIMLRARDLGKRQRFILVTSDDKMRQLAFAYGVECLASEEFALMLGFRPVEVPLENPAADPEKATETRTIIIFEKDPNPIVSKQEIAYWLPIFQQKLHEAQAAKMEAEIAARHAAREAAERRKAQREAEEHAQRQAKKRRD